MNIKELQQRKMKATKEKNEILKLTLSDIIGTAKNAMIADKGLAEETAVEKALQKCSKQTKEMIDSCPDSRLDLKEKYLERLSYIQAYMPKQMDEADIRNAVYQILSNGIQNLKFGSAMKLVMPNLKGKADGKLINKVVKELIDGANVDTYY